MSAPFRVWLIVGWRPSQSPRARAVGVTLATRTDVKKSTSAPPPYASDPTPGAGDRPGRAGGAEGVARRNRARLRILAARYPRSALVRLGSVLRSRSPASRPTRRPRGRTRRRFSRIHRRRSRADDLAHPNAPPGLPPFVPSFSQPTSAAQTHLLRGAAFQQALSSLSPPSASSGGRCRGAERPRGADGRGRRSLRQGPSRARLSRGSGRSSKRFPKAQTVRFHLGLLLIYFGDLPSARRELTLARAQGPTTPLGKRAQTLLRAGRNG